MARVLIINRRLYQLENITLCLKLFTQVHEEEIMSGDSEPNSPRLMRKSSPRGSLVRKIEPVDRSDHRHGVGKI